MIEGYGIITSKTHLYEAIDKDRKQEHESCFTVRDNLNDASDYLEKEANWIIDNLEVQFGAEFNDHVSVKYDYVSVNHNSALKSYDIHVTGFSSVNIYKGEIVFL